MRRVSGFVPAVRKNRYVILPVDFEEAWKVSCLALPSSYPHTTKQLVHFFFTPTSKASSGRTTHTSSVSSLPSNEYYLHPDLFFLVDR